MEKKIREITHWTGWGCNRGAFRRWHWGTTTGIRQARTNLFVYLYVCVLFDMVGFVSSVFICISLLYFIRATVLEGEMWIGGVPAALTAHGCVVSWQSRDGLLGAPLPLNLWQVCACTTYSCWPCGTDGRDAVGCCQKNVLRGGNFVLEWAVSFQTPCPSRSRPGPAMYHPWPIPRVNKWQWYTLNSQVDCS